MRAKYLKKTVYNDSVGWSAYSQSGGGTIQEKEFIARFYCWLNRNYHISSYVEALNWLSERLSIKEKSCDEQLHIFTGKLILKYIYDDHHNNLMETE